MPSLKQLEEFKFSFGAIGNETSIRKAENIPQDELLLPDSEPAAMPSPAPGEAPGGTGDVPPSPPDEAPGASGDEDFDFSAFLDTIPDDLVMPDSDLSGPSDVPGDEAPPIPDLGPELGQDAAPSGDGAEALEIPEAPETAPEAEALFTEEDALLTEAETLFTEDISLPEDSPVPEDSPPPEDLSVTGDTSFPNLSKDLFSESGAPEAVPKDSSPEDLLGLSGSDEDTTEGFDLGDETIDLDTVFAQNNAVPPEDTADALASDSFDSFSLDNAPGFLMPQKEAVDNFADLEEFSLPGMDDVFGGKAGASQGRRATPEEAEEEIQLTQEELDRLQATLGSYPLNLRIACEELIAEKSSSPHYISALVKLLVKGASPQETVRLVAKALDRTMTIPKGFAKKTGEELEEEQASFPYIFTRKFLPVFRIALFVGLVAASIFYLAHRFIYIPIRADLIYQDGYARIEAGEFRRANERFQEALALHRVKKWFYRYAEAFSDARQYLAAEEKYDQLLRFYPRDKKGVLDYAALETGRLRNYPKADSLLRRNILDYAVDDREALLALGDTNLAWAEIDETRYAEARSAYARLLERYGWEDPVVERMLRYFIRTDELGEVLPLQAYFDASERRRLSPATRAELGGYLLDKRFEEARGIPDENISRIDGIRNILLKAVQGDPSLPEAHYHLARYYNHYGYAGEERETLEMAVRTFDAAQEESPKREAYHIDALRRYAQVLVNVREFFPAEEQITRGIKLYEEGVSRRLLSPSPEFGRLYADLGDLEYFTKDGDMEAAIQLYERAEQNGWAPGEIQYRLGSAYYHQQQWGPALERFFAASTEMPLNRRLLYALGNAAYMRGDYFAAQGHFNRLLDLLEQERARFPQLFPNERPEHLELAERLMTARNNLGVTMEALADYTGNNGYRSRALGLYAESARAWDAITRNPQTMVRAGAGDLSTPGLNLAYLNSRNTLNPVSNYEIQIYLPIDKDILEPSPWEALSSSGNRLSEEINYYQ
jgi:tetratricopeptide (TPR) repeat protein